MSTLIPVELEKIINESKERHSFFQLKYFLIGKEPTIQSKLWRCVRELKVRKETSENLLLEIEDVKDDRELIQLSIFEIESRKKENNDTDISEKRDKISIRKLKRKEQELINRLDNLNCKLNNLNEEINYLCSSYEFLSKIEKIKPYDDLDSQKQYWDEKLSQDFYLRNIFNAPVDLELIKTILALSNDSPVKRTTQDLINQTQARLENKNQQKECEYLLDSTKHPTTESKNLHSEGINDI